MSYVMFEFDKDDPDYIEQRNNRKLTEDTHIKIVTLRRQY
jgi:hypothetical protein